MRLPVRNLDNRTFQDIVDEAKKQIVASCPEWTDHNVSDPGVTMIELFAWMTEMIIYRLNQVPERNYIKFLELLGLGLQEPQPAETWITFYLSAPQLQAVSIPERTEVSTVRTETQSPIIFSTNYDFVIRPPGKPRLLVEEVSQPRSTYHELNYQNLAKANAFGAKPNIGNALYFGFEEDLSHHVLVLEVDCERAAPGDLDVKNPPWQWEGRVFNDNKHDWIPAAVEEDTTGGMSQPGRIILRLSQLTPTTIDNKRAYWVRCRVAKPEEGNRGYGESPKLNGIKVHSWGGTVKAVHSSVVEKEILGRSDGSPGQVFQAEYAPLLKREPERGQTVEILPPDTREWEAWREVENFAATTEKDKCFVCDSTTGEVRFGPALADPRGEVRTYGAIPPRESHIRFRAYRYGGGVAGNIRKRTLTVLKTSIPYIDRVTNYEDAKGGVNQTIEMAQLRAPKRLSARGRAVTAGDYETLVKEATPNVARVRCVQPKTGPNQKPAPGIIYVVLVPNINQPYGPIRKEDLSIDHLRETVQNYLNERRLLTVRLDVREPEYIWVAVDVGVTANPNADPERVKQDIEKKLYVFLNPIVGGPDGTGWPFGRDVSPFDILTCLQEVRGIELIQSLKLYQVSESGERTEITQPLHLHDYNLIASTEHQVSVDRMK